MPRDTEERSRIAKTRRANPTRKTSIRLDIAEPPSFIFNLSCLPDEGSRCSQNGCLGKQTNGHFALSFGNQVESPNQEPFEVLGRQHMQWESQERSATGR
jgi:hypothetical protein